MILVEKVLNFYFSNSILVCFTIFIKSYFEDHFRKFSFQLPFSKILIFVVIFQNTHFCQHLEKSPFLLSFLKILIFVTIFENTHFCYHFRKFSFLLSFSRILISFALFENSHFCYYFQKILIFVVIFESLIFMSRILILVHKIKYIFPKLKHWRIAIVVEWRNWRCSMALLPIWATAADTETSSPKLYSNIIYYALEYTG